MTRSFPVPEAVALARTVKIRSTVLLVIGFGCAAALALIFGTAATLPGCTACHTEQTFVEQSAASPHADVDCVTCHVAPNIGSRFSFATQLIFGMTLRVVPTAGRAISGPASAQCLSCHAPVFEGEVFARGLRIQHETCAEEVTCGTCHSGTAHGEAVRWLRVARMDDCLQCHNTRVVSANCGMCHDERTPSQRLGIGSFNVTHGRQWSTTHGMGEKRTCAACHSSDFCVDCHDLSVPHTDRFIERHADIALLGSSACLTCHRTEFCSDCHRTPMPHSDEFSQAHAETVRRDGEDLCRNCHLETDCSNCHTKHVHPGDAMGITQPPPTDHGRR